MYMYCKQPAASDQQPTLSDPQQAADSNTSPSLSMQLSLHANAGSTQEIHMWFPQHSAWPGGTRGAIQNHNEEVYMYLYIYMYIYIYITYVYIYSI